ncbi:MerR family transcriptional regulator [Enterococcus florum]|uniref:MerR family transcriptional regulator n=1 Tax=Enterococcus florum TaxID=2480627 RepID=A0A4P5PES0_9ENTE|nr:MerR family transcriptional regulator [Enterococcus florum]GCF95174.1 MerR family transcriptional regulator [Enterococcus florum]
MLTISQFSKLSQIPTKTLRYYDEISLLKPASIDPVNGYRYYNSQQLATVFLIKKLKNYDCSLEEIKQVLNDRHQLGPLLEKRKNCIAEKIQHYSSLERLIEADIRDTKQGEHEEIDQEKLEIVDSPRLNLFSLRQTIDVRQFDELMAEVFQQLVEKQLTPMGSPLSIYHSSEYTPENYDVEFGIPVLEETSDTRILPSMKAASFHFTGVYEQMTKAYSDLSQFVEEKQLEIIGPAFEIYLTDPNTTSPEKNEVAIYLPVN